MKKTISLSILSGLLLSIVSACSQQELTQDSNLVSNIETFSKSKKSQTITLATYNIKNLFDGVQNPGKQPEKPKPEEELTALSDAIHDINADVIALEEVETKGTLQKFRDKYLSDMNYEIVLREGNDPRGIDVALLSRLPIIGVKSYKNVKINVPGQEPDTFSRDLLQVKMKTENNYQFTLFLTHLKSQIGGDYATAKRKAEAMKIRQFLRDFSKANPKDNYLLAGDLNDVYNGDSLQAILDPKKSDLNLTDLILKDIGFGPDVYSYHPEKYRARIDYILVSPNMMNEYIPQSVNIHKVTKSGDTQTFFKASDHLPVTAKFDVSIDK